MSEPSPFFVVLGPDYAGKSSVMSELANRESAWTFVSVDDAFLAREEPHDAPGLISRLRRALVTDVLPSLGGAYSCDFAASLLQTAVVFLRDQIVAATHPKCPGKADYRRFVLL